MASNRLLTLQGHDQALGMPRFFNTTGPCNVADHYMLPPANRIPTVRRLIEQKMYFVLHAPRQVGKTTTFLALAQTLTEEGRYASLVVSAEVGAPFPDDIGAAELAMLGAWRLDAEHGLDPSLRPPPWPEAPPGQRILAALTAWCRGLSRPLVLFLDEIDSLRGVTLLSVLRQLRDGFRRRPTLFPSSIGLIGMRDVRDYKIASGGSASLQTASPFNIKVESLTLGNFTPEDVIALFAQHTADTEQSFEMAAMTRLYDLTQGQPWLVNALGRQLTEELVPDRTQAITALEVDRAKDILVQRQDTHLDSLAERLREPKIKAVIEPMLAGTELPDVPDDDLRYVVDLGLVIQKQGGFIIANPIYHEVIPRVLTRTAVASLPHIAPTWLRSNGTLDVDQLLNAFLVFWRQHGEPLLRTVAYHEIAPHLVLMAFLHRVVNGGGSLAREYAIGSGRMDLLLTYGDQKLALELKVRRKIDPTKAGLTQLDGYLARLGLNTGWLVIFDQRKRSTPIGERTQAHPMTTPSGRQIMVVHA